MSADNVVNCLPNIRRTFIDDLLHQGKCICGTSLNDGTSERRAVEGYRDRSAEEDIEEAYTVVVGDLESMTQDRLGLYQKINELKKREVEKRHAKNGNDGALDELGSEFESSRFENVRNLQDKRKRLEELLLEEMVEVRTTDSKISDLNVRRREKDNENKKVKAQSEKERLVRKQLEFAQECQLFIQELSQALAEQTRKDISDKVNETFQAILRKKFHAKVDVNYRLKIYKNVPGMGEQEVFEKSTGENQVISLSFIASLVNLAKERSQLDVSFFKGGVYPIVMDSPFGSLDTEYRKKISEYIPKLAEQVVIFASNSQWSKEVDSKCRPYIGREYSLVYHAPAIKGGTHESAVFKQTDGAEYTEIMEGNLEHQ